jgi:endonuclease-3
MRTRRQEKIASSTVKSAFIEKLHATLSANESLKKTNGGTRGRGRVQKRDLSPKNSLKSTIDIEDIDLGTKSFDSDPGSDSNVPIKKKSPKTKRKLPSSNQPPANWYKIYQSLAQFRKSNLAPVDTVGCERLAQVEVDPATNRYQTLIALMLSSQTRDEVTADAMRQLQEKGLNMEGVLSWSDEELTSCISKVSFFRRKTEYIKKTTRVLKEQYHGDIPKTIEGLMGLVRSLLVRIVFPKKLDLFDAI